MSIQKLFLVEFNESIIDDDNTLMLQLNSSCIQVPIVGGTP